MEPQLDAAVREVRATATGGRRRGILVTRRGFNVFTVALSDNVPFGQTHEHQDFDASDKATPRQRSLIDGDCSPISLPSGQGWAAQE